MAPSSRFQIGLPSRSKQKMPRDPNDAISRLPSVAGEADANPCDWWWPSWGTASAAVRRQIVFPLPRSRQSTSNLWIVVGAEVDIPCEPGGGGAGAGASASFTPVSIAVRTNSLLPHTTGVADPEPGSSTFQRRFFDSLQSTG